MTRIGTDQEKRTGGRADAAAHLVIFGAGYVGGEVARQAVARGLRVTALTRNVEKARRLADAGVEVIVDDLAAQTWHAHAALRDGAEWVLNCVSSGGGGPEGYRHSYVEGMKSVVAWAEGARVGTLVYTSSTSVYPQSGGVRVGEDAPIDETRATGSAIVEAEDIFGASKAGARRFVLRLAGIYGPGRHHLIDQLREGTGEVAGRGEYRLNLAHREDIAEAIWAAFDAPTAVAGGVFNVADDGAATKAEVVAFVAAQLGLPVPRFTGEPASGRRRVTPDRVIANDKLKRTLGWRPHYPTFREGYAAILGA